MQKTITKFLVETLGISRRAATSMIKNAQVTINDEIAVSYSQEISETDNITADGQRLSGGKRKYTVLLMNKPKGILSATTDTREKTVIDILPEKYKNRGLFPAGRLDKDSTGLIIITDDGDLAYKLTHPSFEHEKEYYIQAEHELSDGDMKKLASGVDIYEGGMTAPAKIRKLDATQSPYQYSITIHEGKKRQVRRMLATLNNPVLELKRVRMGSFVLPAGLKEGQVLELKVR